MQMSGDDENVTSFNCSADHRSDTYAPGLEKASTDGTLDFKLISSDPAPPSHGDNTWVISVNSMADNVVGAPMTGLTNASFEVVPYMPDHMHTAGVTVFATPVDGQDGQYTLDPLHLWMAGVWQTTIAVTQPGGTQSKVVYTFCLPD